jgi:hypothetical protein
MNRLLVSLLSVFDAAVAAAVGVAIALAPLTLVFVPAFGGTADWESLWPAGAAVWQLGHLVPQTITLPGEYLAAAGISADAASFVLSLAPLGFTAFTAIFAARSGARAAAADGWVTGVVSSSLVFAVLAAAIALTSGSGVAQAPLWQAVLFPALVFALPAVAGAIAGEWREAGAGVIARMRDRIEALGGGWGDVPGLAVRGAAVVLVALIGFGALALVVALVFGGAQVIALYEAAHVDALGATVITLGQLAYLPTLLVWAISFLAGPGFAIGAGTAVSPAGTQLGVVPGIPLLGVIPESSSSWLLLLVLLPVAAGALAGWVVRSHLVARSAAAVPAAAITDTPWATAALDGLIGPPTPLGSDDDDEPPHEPVGPRLAITVLIAVLSGAASALLAALASGSLGPGRLAEVGPPPGPLALAVGLEVLVGAGILLLGPRRRADDDEREWQPEGTTVPTRRDGIPFADALPRIPFADEPHPDTPADADPDAAPPAEPAPLPPLRTPDPDGAPSAPSPRRPSALPPVD